MLDIARAVRPEMRLHLLAKRLAQIIININQILPPAVSDIERLTSRVAWRQTRLEIRLNDIINISEIPRLPAVAVDRGHLAVEQLFDKFGNHGRIRAVGVLPAPKYIKIAKSIGV